MTTLTPVLLTDDELSEVRAALADRAKKWRKSLASMERDERVLEHLALIDRLALLNSARRKLGAVLSEEDE